jgi:lipopolysaccharide transport system permease protein
MALELEYVIGPSRKKIFNWKEIWNYRELFYFFAWRDIKVKYKETFLGITWVVLQPIFTVVIFSLFFGKAFHAPQGIPYPVFVFSGLLLWTFFSSSVSNAGSSMLSQAPIIKKIYFPRIIIPISVILAAFLDLLVAFVVFIFTLIYFHVSIDLMLLLVYWPVAFFFMFIGTLGLSCWLSALVVKYRDFRHVIPFALQLLLFLTPIIYPISVISQPWVKYVLALNPMYGAITLFRLPFAELHEPWALVLISAASSVVLLVAGIFYFKRTEDFFADLA